ncbi:MAG TPA: FAD-dependent oxidoreductase [Trebonia sp.]|nr:FAD-dependent oxidoreductase [Trebonia sp.]
MDEPPVIDDAPLADPAEVRRAMEFYAARGWTDGLPVVPVTGSYLAEFLATTARAPSDVVIAMPHLNRALTVRLAAINAALAGCLPSYFPVVLAAWDSFLGDGGVSKAIWQSTTGTAPFTVVNGPVRTAIGLNSRGNLYGSGFRANATIGRAIRLGSLNAFGLRPHVLDQATQGTPAKYSCCIAENEEDSPWAPLHVDNGLAATDSACTSTVIRSVLHIEARHTIVPEQLAEDLADSIGRTGAMVRAFASVYVVLNPEHARLLDSRGWSKQDLREAIVERGSRTYRELAASGKEAIAKGTGWRLPADHPDALPQTAPADLDAPVPILRSVHDVQVVVAGAPNAGVSSVVETFGAVGRPPSVAKVEIPGQQQELSNGPRFHPIGKEIRLSGKTIVEPSRATPVYGEFDVVVVGGGPAGIMAASAAARAGHSTLLIERYGFLGGAGTAGGLSTFCGLHARTRGADVRVIRGLADELLDRLAKLDGLNAPHLTIADGIAAQAFDISAYKIAADELVTGSGARILFHAMAVGAVMADAGVIDAVLIESKSGRQAVRGRFFVDASGDGDLAAWAGVPWEKAPPIDGMMYPSLMFRINGVNVERAGPAPWRTVERLMDEAERAGTHTFPRKKPIVRPQRNPLEWRANLTQLRTASGGAIDGTDVDQLTLGELTGRQQALDAFTFIRDRTPGFEDSYIVDIAPQIGIRETRRIIGAYQLTEDDVLGCADFDDTIGVNGWPVEAHVAGTVEFRWQRDERGFNQLPFRIIVPPATGNLYVAGRCASMTHGAQSAARVTGPCFVMGEAAGVAAGMALDAAVTGDRIDVPELQRRLENEGAFLGRGEPVAVL